MLLISYFRRLFVETINYSMHPNIFQKSYERYAVVVFCFRLRVLRRHPSNFVDANRDHVADASADAADTNKHDGCGSRRAHTDRLQNGGARSPRSGVECGGGRYAHRDCHNDPEAEPESAASPPVARRRRRHDHCCK